MCCTRDTWDWIATTSDPGVVASRANLLAALAKHGPEAADVTDVVLSHHHPDHTVNAALFPNARIHDHWAIYSGDRWTDRDAENFQLSPDVRDYPRARTRVSGVTNPGPPALLTMRSLILAQSPGLAPWVGTLRCSG
jgi:glyoxylase-like metal-dependent hydrolase (beta-lactamase superfamily II)